jgi:hypothetical protein
MAPELLESAFGSCFGHMRLWLRGAKGTRIQNSHKSYFIRGGRTETRVEAWDLPAACSRTILHGLSSCPPFALSPPFYPRHRPRCFFIALSPPAQHHFRPRLPFRSPSASPLLTQTTSVDRFDIPRGGCPRFSRTCSISRNKGERKSVPGGYQNLVRFPVAIRDEKIADKLIGSYSPILVGPSAGARRRKSQGKRKT